MMPTPCEGKTPRPPGASHATGRPPHNIVPGAPPSPDPLDRTRSSRRASPPPRPTPMRFPRRLDRPVLATLVVTLSSLTFLLTDRATFQAADPAPDATFALRRG